ncbi:MAG: hypothetical protein NTU56_06225 [Proteobacteria bacterium]|nr:hypothetical protein [Pseudomonadota bacterium]
MTRRRLRTGSSLLALAFAAAGVGAPAGAQTAADASPAGAAPTVNAVWTEHEFTFTYFGRGTYYSCGGLDDKIEYILTALGARPEPWVQVNCLDGGGVQLMPTARIKVAVPTEATPELLAQLEADKSKRELVAKVQRKGTTVDVATAQFPAERRIVEFEGRRLDHINDGDCELFDQLLPQVLEPLGIREAPGSSLTCIPRMSQFGSVHLKLESLHAQPAAVAEPAKP